MKRKFINNIDKCVGCNSCVMACKNEYQTPPDLNYRKVYPMNELEASPERNYISFACAHCESPACLENCPVAAYTKRADGVVIHEIGLCIGCKLCTVACPYGSPKYNKTSGKVFKCQLCYQRLDAGMLPSCVEACPVGALGMIDLDTSTVSTSVGESKASGTVDHIAELPSNKITNPQHRFVLRKPAKQVKYKAGSLA